MFELVNFDERGLVPCIAQDADSGLVLTLAYANDDGVLSEFLQEQKQLAS